MIDIFIKPSKLLSCGLKIKNSNNMITIVTYLLNQLNY